MREVYANLFVGNASDYETVRENVDWSYLQCAKEPWHREALGYTGQRAPRADPEYLVARRGRRLILNMVDAERAVYFHPDMMEAGVEFIDKELERGQKVLVCCNQGGSRAPGMAFFWLWKRHGFCKDRPYDVGEIEFRDNLYPFFRPSNGIREFIRIEWRRENAKSDWPTNL